MINTTVQVAGWVTDANIFSPEQKYGEEPKYTLTLTPFDPYEFGEIERKAEMMKLDWEASGGADRYWEPGQVEYSGTKRKDSLIDGCGILFGHSMHHVSASN